MSYFFRSWSKNESILYPNPTTGNVTINIDLPFDFVVTINLYDSIGNIITIIKNDFAYKGNFEVNYNCNHLSQGTYYLKIQQKDFTKTLKLIKEK